jgi:hypothetical protein
MRQLPTGRRQRTHCQRPSPGAGGQQARSSRRSHLPCMATCPPFHEQSMGRRQDCDVPRHLARCRRNHWCLLRESAACSAQPDRRRRDDGREAVGHSRTAGSSSGRAGTSSQRRSKLMPIELRPNGAYGATRSIGILVNRARRNETLLVGRAVKTHRIRQCTRVLSSSVLQTAFVWRVNAPTLRCA